MNEMDVLLDMYPSLKHDNWVLIVDRDPAKFKAARIKFERVRIIFCLYHATENIKKHFEYMCLTTATEIAGEIRFAINSARHFIGMLLFCFGRSYIILYINRFLSSERLLDTM